MANPVVPDPRPLIATERRSTRLGTALPNPGSGRTFVPNRTTMDDADAPVVTLGAAASPITTSISGGIEIARTHGALRYFRGIPGAVGASAPSSSYYQGKGFVTSPITSFSLSFDFCTDSRYIEFDVRNPGSSGRIRILVDGVPAKLDDGSVVHSAAFYNLATIAGWFSASVVSGSIYPLKFDLGSQKPGIGRRIRVDFTGNFAFRAFWIDATATAWRASNHDIGPFVIGFGDSFGEGNGSSDGDMGSFFTIAGEELGWEDVQISSVGATGFLNPATGGKVTFLSRVVADVIDQRRDGRPPDIVMVAGALNDINYDPGTGIVSVAEIVTAIITCCQTIDDALPDTKIILFGAWVGSSGIQTNIDTLNAALQTAVLLPGSGVDLFLNQSTGNWYRPTDGTSGSSGARWLTGSGRSGAPAGTGNADLYRGGSSGSDTTHPTHLGQVYYGHRAAQDIDAARPF